MNRNNPRRPYAKVVILAAVLCLVAVACDLPEKFPVYQGDVTVGPFVKYPANPVLSRGAEGDAFDAAAVSSPSVLVEKGGSLRMYYAAVDATGLRTIGLAASAEGLLWERGSMPVITPTAGAFDEGGVSDPGAFYDGERYWVFFTAQDKDGNTRIGVASSGDGEHFEKGASPVIEPGPDPSPDSGGVGEPSVVRDEAGGKFYLYYTGFNQYAQGSIMLATSTDGLAWSKYGIDTGSPQPVLGLNTVDTAFDVHSVEAPTVLITQSREGRTMFRMWYAGSMKEGSVHVGLAGSAAAEGQAGGLNWERYPASPVMHYARSPSVVDYKENLYLYYNELGIDESAGISLSTRLGLTQSKE